MQCGYHAGGGIPDNWKQVPPNQDFSSDNIVGYGVAWQPATNQDVINAFYKIGKRINPEKPWEYMATQKYSLDDLIKRGRENNYFGSILPEEIRRENKITPVPVGNSNR